MVDALNQLTKGAVLMAHSLVLVRNHVADLQAANEAYNMDEECFMIGAIGKDKTISNNRQFKK